MDNVLTAFIYTLSHFSIFQLSHSYYRDVLKCDCLIGTTLFHFLFSIIMLLAKRTVKKKISSTKLRTLAPTKRPVVPPTDTEKELYL